MDKVLKWVLIGCLVIPVVIVMIAVLAGIVLVAINPAESLERARRVTVETQMAALDRSIAIVKVETPKPVLSCDELADTVDLTPKTANSCVLKMGDAQDDEMNLVYSFNAATGCAVVSTQGPVVGEGRYLYYKFTEKPSQSKLIALESMKMEQCQ